jgi:hypothetical protein
MNLLKKKYIQATLIFIAIFTPVIAFLYEAKKMAGIKDLFDIDDDIDEIQ